MYNSINRLIELQNSNLEYLLHGEHRLSPSDITIIKAMRYSEYPNKISIVCDCIIREGPDKKRILFCILDPIKTTINGPFYNKIIKDILKYGFVKVADHSLLFGNDIKNGCVFLGQNESNILNRGLYTTTDLFDIYVNVAPLATGIAKIGLSDPETYVSHGEGHLDACVIRTGCSDPSMKGATYDIVESKSIDGHDVISKICDEAGKVLSKSLADSIRANTLV
jgi:hypothetical protein